MVEKCNILTQKIDEIEGDSNLLSNLNLYAISKNPHNWKCELIISISSMKEHAALIIASLDDYCAVVETSEGFHVFFVKIHEFLHL